MSAVLKIRPELDTAALDKIVAEQGRVAGTSFGAEFEAGTVPGIDATATAMTEKMTAASTEAAKASSAAATAGAAKVQATTAASTEKVIASNDAALASVGKAHGALSSLMGLGSGFVAYSGVKSAMAMQQFMGASNLIFGKASEDVKKFAEDQATSIGIAPAEALQQLNQLGQVSKTILGANNAQAAQISQSLLKRSQDIAIATGGDQQEILNTMTTALAGGPSRALKRYGVSINEAALQQEALRLGLIHVTGDATKANLIWDKHVALQERLGAAQKKYGVDSIQAKTIQDQLTKNEADYQAALAGKIPKLTQAQRSQAAYALILRQTNTYNDYFSKHAGDPAEKLAKTRAEFAKFEEQLGNQLLPILLQVLKPLDTMMQTFNDAPKWLQGTILWSAGAAFGLTKLGNAISAVKNGVSAASDLMKSFTRLLGLNTEAATTAAGAEDTNAAAKERSAAASQQAAAAQAELDAANSAGVSAAAGAAAAEGELAAADAAAIPAIEANTAAKVENSAASAGMGGLGRFGGLAKNGVAALGAYSLYQGGTGIWNDIASGKNIDLKSGAETIAGVTALAYRFGGPEAVIPAALFSTAIIAGGRIGQSLFGNGSGGVPGAATGATVYPNGTLVRLAEGGEPEDVVPHSKRAGYAAAVGGGSTIHYAPVFNITVEGGVRDEATLAKELDRTNRSTAAKILRTQRVPA